MTRPLTLALTWLSTGVLAATAPHPALTAVLGTASAVAGLTLLARLPEVFMVRINHEHLSRVLTARQRPLIGVIRWRPWSPRAAFLASHRMAELRVVRSGVTVERRPYSLVDAARSLAEWRQGVLA